MGEIDRIEEVADGPLANMLIRYMSWYSYATVELSYAKVTAAALNEIFELKVANEMSKAAKTQEGRTVKDVLRGIAIQTSEELTSMERQKIEVDGHS